MLTGQNQPFYACGFECVHPLICVKGSRIEDRFGFRAVAPFLVGKRIDREMRERVKLHLLDGKLPGRGCTFDKCFVKFKIFVHLIIPPVI